MESESFKYNVNLFNIYISNTIILTVHTYYSVKFYSVLLSADACKNQKLSIACKNGLAFMTYQMKYFCFGTDQNVSGQVEVESLRVRHLQFVSTLNQIQIEQYKN